ncbi:unnamed protein product [Heligmosomoides polygyrus]|uniref:Glutathione S-transferase omega n=1 Tax=Heligmosomoides polygyrus TaxID=6339 RepID=A0A183F7A7_HELPZ|nr:unnamed protein product [Heligmosomoides polygyrus]
MNGAHLTYNEQADRSGDELKSSSGPLRLIAMRFCPWCERVLLTLAQKNIRERRTAIVEVVNVDLSDKPEFLFEKHPEGKVPVLEHNGQTIIDSALIAEYLDWIQPETSVLPADPYLRAKQRMIASIIEARVRLLSGVCRMRRFMEVLHDALKTAEKQLNNTFYGGKLASTTAPRMSFGQLPKKPLWSVPKRLF